MDKTQQPQVPTSAVLWAFPASKGNVNRFQCPIPSRIAPESDRIPLVVWLMDYREAGVDVEAGRAFVDKIRNLVHRTYRPEVIGGLGGFSGCFHLPSGYTEPVLVSGTDGVGTKLKLACELNRHDTVGIDLVAMCVNDVLTCGAEPLFFLDYLATGKLNQEQLTQVVAGISAGCQLSGCALLGGETAEMPDFIRRESMTWQDFASALWKKVRCWMVPKSKWAILPLV